MPKRPVPECVSDELIERCRLDLSADADWRKEASAAAAQAQRCAPAADAPPLTNRGGAGNAARYEAIAAAETVEVRLDDGAIKTVAVRRPCNGQVAVVDTLRFTVGEESFGGGLFGSACVVLIDDESMSHEISRVLFDVFGFGITGYTGHGGDFYLKTYTLGDRYGSVSLGGASQNATVLVNLTGEGCAAAREGWERRLYEFFMRYGNRAQITRVDLAYDDFHGRAVSVEWADRAYLDGGFTSWKMRPSHEHRGNWLAPDGSGRSVYIGKRQNGKMCRVYEKGREQGDRASEWVRCEVELRSKDRIIPLDVLLNPSSYFCGAYPCLDDLKEAVTPARIEVKQKSAEINVEAATKNLRHSYGAYVAVLFDLYGPDEFMRRVAVVDRFPRRLCVPSWETCAPAMHTWAPATPRAGVGSLAAH